MSADNCISSSHGSCRPGAKAPDPVRASGAGGLRWSALAAGIGVALAASAPLHVHAQSAQTAAGDAAQPPQSGPIEEVTVTGSRIRSTSGFETSTPVTSVSLPEMKDFDPGNTVSSQLSSLPQFFNNRTSQQSSNGSRFSPAANAYTFLDLRNLGGNRTLVLLDGYRLPPSDKDGTVNVDLLPTALMRSVDVVTGGASAAYGADAVGGVVNFVLDRQFQGLSVDVGTGQEESGGGATHRLGIAAGHGFLDGRVNIIGSLESLEIDQIHGDRNSVDNFHRIGWVKNPAWSPGAPAGVPQRLTLPDVVSTLSSPTGLIRAPGTPLDYKQFTLDGTGIMPFVLGDVVSLPGEAGGTSSMSGGPEAARAYDTFDNSPSGSGVTTRSYFLGFELKATDRLSFTVDAREGSTETLNRSTRGGYELESPWNALIAVDNAFLPENVRQIMMDNGLTQLTVNKLGAYTDRPEVGSNTVTDNTLTQTQFSGGFEFRVPGNEWILQGHVQHAKAKRHVWGRNVIREDRLFLAMDAVRDPATGEIVCRVQTVDPTVEQLQAAVAGRVSSVPLDPSQPAGVPGNTKPLESPIGLDNTIRDCVPLNVLGSGNMSQAALDYVTTDKTGIGNVEQDFAEVLVSGDVFKMPAGRASFAAGLTWRDQKFDDRADTPTGIGVGGQIVTVDDLGPPINVPSLGIRGIPRGIEGGSANLNLFSTIPNIAGDTSVWEWYGELQLPLWKQVSMNLADRQSDYKRSGVSDSWKVGLDAPVLRDWRLRVTRSQDMREPTFEELFDAQGGGASVTDPNFDNATVQTNTLSGGNPNLAPEIGDTSTAGIVWQPTFARWITGLQLSLDWYDIQIKDRVDSLSAQRIIDECHDNNVFCDRIIRDPDTGALVNVHQTYLNLSRAEVEGKDLEVLWQFQPNLFASQSESLTVHLLGARLDKSTTTAFGSVPLDVAGQVGTPKYSHVLTVNYAVGSYSFQLQNRYIDSTILNVNWVEGVDVDDNSVSSMSWWNARIGYNGKLGNGAAWSVNFNIQNVFDRDPPVIPGFGTRGGTQVFNSAYDVFGQRYNLGASYRF